MILHTHSLKCNVENDNDEDDKDRNGTFDKSEPIQNVKSANGELEIKHPLHHI